jgi:hypothetical protein
MEREKYIKEINSHFAYLVSKIKLENSLFVFLIRFYKIRNSRSYCIIFNVFRNF